MSPQPDPPECAGCVDPEIGGLRAAWIEGLLDGERRLALERHLEDCEACLAAVEEGPGPVAPLFEPTSPRTKRRVRRLRIAAIAGAACLLVGAVFLFRETARETARKALADAGEGRIAAAVPQAEEALRRAPDDRVVQAWCGRVFLRAGRLDRALDLLRKSVERAPEPLDAWGRDAYEDLVATLRRLGDREAAYAAAEAFLRLAGGAHAGPFPATEEGVGLAATPAAALRARAWVKADLDGDIDGALADLRAAMAVIPDAEKRFPAHLVLIDEIRIYLDYLGDLEKAGQLIEELARMREKIRDPTDETRVEKLQLANQLENLGRVDLLRYQQLDGADPALLADARTKYGDALRLRGKNARGKGWCLSALALIRYLEGDAGRALAEFREASRYKRENGIRDDRILDEIQIAQLLLRDGRASEAEGHSKQALALAREAADRPGEARALLTLGMVQRALGREEAPASLAAAREIAERYRILAVMREIRKHVDTVLATKSGTTPRPFLRP